MKCGSDEGLNFVTGDKMIDSLWVEVTENRIIISWTKQIKIFCTLYHTYALKCWLTYK